jgi:predicted phosphodiesterase
MDRSQGLAQAVEETLGHGRLAWLHRLTLDGHALALIHGDNEEMLEHLIASDGCAAIFHGHTHRRRDRTMGRTRVVNPGSLGGVRGIRYSFCIFDLATREARFVEVR